jgi:hypothetical protein
MGEESASEPESTKTVEDEVSGDELVDSEATIENEPSPNNEDEQVDDSQSSEPPTTCDEAAKGVNSESDVTAPLEGTVEMEPKSESSETKFEEDPVDEPDVVENSERQSEESSDPQIESSEPITPAAVEGTSQVESYPAGESPSEEPIPGNEEIAEVNDVAEPENGRFVLHISSFCRAYMG